jgi:GcrA cell cycle regulator
MSNGALSPWTKEMTAELVRLVAEGRSFSQIGAALGVTRNACIGRARRIGVSYREGNVRPRPIRLAPVASAAISPPPIPPLEPAEPPAPIPPAITKRVRPIDVRAGQCRWPYGNPDESDFSFCGKMQEIHSSYCAEHAAMAFQKKRA